MTQFSIELTVRDYECDMQGVVNHANYLHYLEHARHEFLKTRGLDFAQMTAQGLIVMVVAAQLEYRRSLRSGDRFRVTLQTAQRSRLRLDFQQRIERIGDDCLMLSACITTAAVDKAGRPCFPPALRTLLPDA